MIRGTWSSVVYRFPGGVETCSVAVHFFERVYPWKPHAVKAIVLIVLAIWLLVSTTIHDNFARYLVARKRWRRCSQSSWKDPVRGSRNCVVPNAPGIAPWTGIVLRPQYCFLNLATTTIPTTALFVVRIFRNERQMIATNAARCGAPASSGAMRRAYGYEWPHANFPTASCGTILLSQDRLDVGMVAHELQHAALHYGILASYDTRMEKRKTGTKRSDHPPERRDLAGITENLTRHFTAHCRIGITNFLMKYEHELAPAFCASHCARPDCLPPAAILARRMRAVSLADEEIGASKHWCLLQATELRRLADGLRTRRSCSRCTNGKTNSKGRIDLRGLTEY